MISSISQKKKQDSEQNELTKANSLKEQVEIIAVCLRPKPTGSTAQTTALSPA